MKDIQQSVHCFMLLKKLEQQTTREFNIKFIGKLIYKEKKPYRLTFFYTIIYIVHVYMESRKVFSDTLYVLNN